jgi:hypothetical protein
MPQYIFDLIIVILTKKILRHVYFYYTTLSSSTNVPFKVEVSLSVLAEGVCNSCNEWNELSSISFSKSEID